VNHPNRRTLQLLTLTPLALAFAMSASAASRTELHNQNVSLLNSQYKLAAASGMPTRPEDRHAEMLGLDADSRLSVLTHNQDADGTQHYRYQQSFRGTPIWGEQVVVSEDKGGNIKQRRKTKSAAPVYPSVLQEAGLEGVVKLDVLIDTEGHVSSVRVLNSLVHPAFADAAATAVKQWEFTPTLLNGVPVEVAMTVSISFSLSD